MKQMAALLLVSALLGTACQPEKVQVRPHEDSPTWDPTLHSRPLNDDPAFQTLSADLRTLAQNSTRIATEIERGEHPELVLRLAPVVLDPGFVLGALSQSPTRLRLASLYLLSLREGLKRNRSESSREFMKMRDFITDGCSETGEGCLHLGFFSRLPSTSDVFTLGLSQEAEALAREFPTHAALVRGGESRLREFYRDLRLGALLPRNSTADNRISLLYVRFAASYGEVLEKAGPPVLLNQHWNRVPLVMTELRAQRSRGTQDSGVYCDFIQQLRPLAADSPVYRFGRQGRISLLSDLVDCAPSAQALESVLRAHMQERRQQTQTDVERRRLDMNPDRPLPVEAPWEMVDAVLRSRGHVMNALGVQPVQISEGLEFVLAAVDSTSLSPQVAARFARKLTQGPADAGRLLEATEYYIRAQSLYQVFRSQQALAAELQEQWRKHGGLSSNFFLDLVTGVTGRTQSSWMSMRERVARLRELLVLTLDDTYGSRAMESRPSVELRAIGDMYRGTQQRLHNFDSYRRAHLTAPLMFPVNYYLSQATGTVSFLIPWWSSDATGSSMFTLNANQAVSRALDAAGDIAQLFNYGDRSVRLDRLQTQYNLALMLRTGLLDVVPLSLDERNSSEQPEVLLFKRYLFETMDVVRGSFNENLRSLREVERSEDFRWFTQEICENPFSAPINLTLSRLQEGTLPLSSVSGSSGFLSRLYSQRVGEFAYVLRENAERLYQVFEDHLASPGWEERLSPRLKANRTAILQAMRSELDQRLRVERDYNRLWAQLDQRVVPTGATPEEVRDKDCMQRLIRADWFRRRKIFELNIEFYRDVHSGLTLLKALREELTANPNTQAALATFGDAILARTPDRLRPRAQRTWQTLAGGGVFALVDPSRPILDRLREALAIQYGIHNQTNAPWVEFDASGRARREIGYWVEGLQNDSQGRRMRRNNEFFVDRFRQTRWDSVMRVRRQLQKLEAPVAEVVAAVPIRQERLEAGAAGTMPLAPRLDIQVGTLAELENDRLNYSDLPRMDVAYTEDEESFVQAAMIQFGGWQNSGGVTGSQHLSWFSPSGANLAPLQERLTQLMIINRNPVETSERPCVRNALGSWEVRDGCEALKPSPDSVLQYLRSWVDLVGMSEADRNIFQYLTWRSVFGQMAFSLFEGRRDNRVSSFVYLDRIYSTHYASRAYQGEERDGRGQRVVREDIEGLDEFLIFRTSLAEKFRPEDHLFAVPGSFVASQRQHLRMPILRHIHATKEFERAVETLENAHRETPAAIWPDLVIDRENGVIRADESYEFGNYRTMRVQRRSSEDPRAGTPIYLSSDTNSARGWFWSFLRGFVVSRSLCEFVPVAGEVDHHPDLDTGSCEERFEKWLRRSQLR